MRKLFLTGAAIAAVSTSAWLFAGGEACSEAAKACSDKTSLVTTDGKACETTTAAKAEGACCSGGDKTTLVSTDGAAAAPAGKPFDALKQMAGKWKKSATGEAENKMEGEIDFKVSSGGSAIVETMFPGTNFEMTNVYVMDGEKLLVTHYCAGGNAPRMQLTKNEGGKLVFEFLDATNLSNRNAPHMGALTLTIAGPDKMTETWTHFKDGKEGGKVNFEMERIK